MNLKQTLGNLAGPKSGPTVKPVEVDWNRPFDTLRDKWREVPSGALERCYSEDLLKLSDDDLMSRWAESHDASTVWDQRGWYRELYKDFVKDKKLLDIGCGLGFDTTYFAECGATVTFVDLVQSNLDIVKRICDLRGIRATFCQLVDLESLKSLGDDYDVVTAIGSLHHAPIDVIKPEVQEIAKHLLKGGRWLQFAYPKARWEREGRLAFGAWGQRVDGDRCQWAEWYDVDKIMSNLSPHAFDVVFYYEWHNQDFNWFDLKKT